MSRFTKKFPGIILTPLLRLVCTSSR